MTVDGWPICFIGSEPEYRDYRQPSMIQPADSRVPVVVNRNGGAASRAGDALRQQIEDAFAKVGRHAEVQLLDGCDIVDAVTRLAAERLVVAAGGDGTLGCAAGALLSAGAGAALGILPLGTRNHLARELGIPLDLPGAARTIAEGQRRRMDVGSVNDVVFVNNASIGVYPQLVRIRDAARRTRRYLPKWAASLIAAGHALRNIRSHRFHLDVDGQRQVVRSPLLFVGNNVYELDAGRIGRRRRLDGGNLSLLAVASATAWESVWIGLRTIAGRSDVERDFAALEVCAELEIAERRRTVTIALDGEIQHLQTPLRFESRPLALEVIAPAET